MRILQLILKGLCQGVDWIQVANDRNQRQAVVNTVTNF